MPFFHHGQAIGAQQPAGGGRDVVGATEAKSLGNDDL